MRKTLLIVSVVVGMLGLVGGCTTEEEGDPSIDIEAEIQRLSSSDAHTRVEAAMALGRAGPPAAPAIPHLVDALGDNAEVPWGPGGGTISVGSAAALGLSSIGNRAVEPLIATLQTDDAQIRQRAVVALGEIGDRRATEPLVTLLGDEDKAVRSAAVQALGNIGDRRATEPLITALSDDDPEVRRNAARSLAQIGGREVVEPLLAALSDNNAMVRLGAAQALGEVGGSRAGEPLITLLNNDASENVRAVAAQALGELRERRAIEPLVAALSDDYNALRLTAAEALANITGQDFGQDPAAWQEWLDR